MTKRLKARDRLPMSDKETLYRALCTALETCNRADSRESDLHWSYANDRPAGLYETLRAEIKRLRNDAVTEWSDTGEWPDLFPLDDSVPDRFKIEYETPGTYQVSYGANLADAMTRARIRADVGNRWWQKARIYETRRDEDGSRVWERIYLFDAVQLPRWNGSRYI